MGIGPFGIEIDPGKLIMVHNKKVDRLMGINLSTWLNSGTALAITWSISRIHSV